MELLSLEFINSFILLILISSIEETKIPVRFVDIKKEPFWRVFLNFKNHDKKQIGTQNPLY